MSAACCASGTWSNTTTTALATTPQRGAGEPLPARAARPGAGSPNLPKEHRMHGPSNLRRLRGALIVAAVAVGLLVSPVSKLAQPAHADPVGDEVQRSDVHLDTTNLGFDNSDTRQGWGKAAAAYFNDQDRPDCAIATPEDPSDPASTNVPMSVQLTDFNSVKHRARATKGTSGLSYPTPFSYWLHAARDDTSDTKTICTHTSVTTNSTGYFTVTFPRTLDSTPAFVVWEEEPDALFSDGEFVTAKSSTGFTGRMMNGSSSRNNFTATISYWASTETAIDVDDEVVDGGYYNEFAQRGAQTNVTTNADGNATIDYTDFESGFDPTSGQVTGCTDTGSNINSGMILVDIGNGSATVNARKAGGVVIANATICINYVIVGDEGGAGKPVTLFDGGNGVDYYQVGLGVPPFNNPNGDGTRCQDSSHFCARWREPGSPSVNYHRDLLDPVHGVNWPNINGVAPSTYIQNALDEWGDADGNWLDFSTHTPSTGAHVQMWYQDDGPSGGCAVTTYNWDYSPTDGLNFITDFTSVFNADSAAVWGNYSAGGATNCWVEQTAMHEIGHGYGLAHNDGSAGSIMYPYSFSGVQHLPEIDRLGAANIYGDSTSDNLWPKGFKASTLVSGGDPEAFARALVTVKAVGKPKMVKGAHVSAGGWEIRTPVTLTTNDAWQGTLPTTGLWMRGGKIGNKSSSCWPVCAASLKPGDKLLVQARLFDRAIVQALPDDAGTLTLPAHLPVDDLDGGNTAKVGLSHARAAALAVQP
jgi:hypothetical protein